MMAIAARNCRIFFCLILAAQLARANIPFNQVKFQIFDKEPTNFEIRTTHSVNSIKSFFDSAAVKDDLIGKLKTVIPYLSYLDILTTFNDNLLKSESDWAVDFIASIENSIESSWAKRRFILMETIIQSIHGKIARLDQENQPNLATRKANARYIQSNLESLIDYFAENDGIFKQLPLLSAPLLINVALIIAVFTPIGNQLIPGEVNDLQLACKAKDVLEDYRTRVIFLRAKKINSMDLYYKYMAPVLTRPYNPLGYAAEDSSGISHCTPGCTDNDKSVCLIDEFGEGQKLNLKNGDGISFDCITEYVGLVRHRTEKMFPVEMLDKLCVDRKPRTPTGKGWLTIDLGILHAYGDDDGAACEAIGDSCDPFLKFFVNDNLIYKSETRANTLTFDVNYHYTSELIPKTSTIKIEIWDDDSGFLGSESDLVLRTVGDISSFVQNPFRGGTTVTKTSPSGQNSINTLVFWEDEYE